MWRVTRWLQALTNCQRACIAKQSRLLSCHNYRRVLMVGRWPTFLLRSVAWQIWLLFARIIG
jgi:hypothetical protein